jgi:hypothetical protein
MMTYARRYQRVGYEKDAISYIYLNKYENNKSYSLTEFDAYIHQ